MKKISILVVTFLSFSTGIAISSAIFAFLSAVGLIPRFISKTKTDNTILLYENIIVVGGLVSAVIFSFDLEFNINEFFLWYYMFSLGVFLGCLAVCLTEVIDAMPVIVKFANIKNKIAIIIVAIALGKGIGAFIFYYILQEAL